MTPLDLSASATALTRNTGAESSGRKSSGDEPARAADAAKQFEAILIARMLESARQSGGGWLGETDDASQTMTGFAEEHLAEMLAQAGGFGLSKLLGSSLEQRAAPRPDPIKP
ncbi:MAG: hypothetical protein U0Q16_39155 [Bryobacteraceae bacterium]